MSWINDPTIRVLTGALGGLQARTQAIASNISNVDTPGYAPVKVDFESELSRQLADAGITVTGDGTVSTDANAAAASGSVRPVHLAQTAPGHLAAANGTAGSGVTEETFLASYRNDGNAVDVDQSMTLLAETQLKYGATTRLLNGQLGMLRDVITSTGGR